MPSKSPSAAAEQATTNAQSAVTDPAATDPIPTAPDVKKKKALGSKLAKSFEEAVARGDATWLNGDAETAIYLYVQALSFRPRDFDTLCKLGSIEQSRDNPELAVRAFELAAEVKPADSRVTARLGLIFLEQGDDDRASTWLNRSADAGSTDWRVYDGLGVIDSKHSDSAGALKHLQQAVTLAPTLPTPWLHRGQALFAAGDFDAAESALHAAIKYGDPPEASKLLGQIQAKRRAYSEALESLLRALDPPQAYDIVAKLAMANGDNAVALRYFDQAAQLSPVYFADAHHDAAIARERLTTSP